MSDKESAQSVIESYRRKQQNGPRTLIILIIGALLLIGGAALVIFWAAGSKPQMPSILVKPSETSTVTVTALPTNTPLPPTPTTTLPPTETQTQPPTETATPADTPTPSGPFLYTVQEGDNLGSIAAKYKTDVATILALNPSIDPTTLIIHVGDQILIPTPDTQLPTATPLPTGLARGTLIPYTVVPGDTLLSIAERFNSTVDAIVKANPDKLKTANDTLFVGWILKIPVNLVTPIPTATQGTVYPTAPVETNTPQP